MAFLQGYFIKRTKNTRNYVTFNGQVLFFRNAARGVSEHSFLSVLFFFKTGILFRISLSGDHHPRGWLDWGQSEMVR